MTSKTTGATRIRFATLAIFALGFRPFYLLAAIFAVVTLPVWMGFYFGITPPGGYLSGIAWHSHEMVFGFAAAVIAGFLLTAVRNWTGQPTPVGGALAALVALWLLGRVLMLTGPSMLAAVVDLTFLPALGLAIAIPIGRSRNTRNFKILIVLGGLAIVNLSFHLAQLGVLPVDIGRLSIILALDIIVILMAVIAGRIIPAFIKNAVPAARPKNLFGTEAVALGSLVLILAADAGNYWFHIPSSIWFGLLVVAAIAHIIRLLLWDPLQTRRNALLWMLPVAYAWIPVSLMLRALAALPMGLSVTVAFHALTIGAIASLMVAMMTRSALGHTGRKLKAGRIEISAFVLLQVATIVRIVPGLVWPQNYQAYVAGSATLWSFAFGIFVLGYWKVLTRPRIDGTE
ncbi:MAG: NnrS family protein [Proteobacteria bacterium]|nr:NnrS family protein [Pseudomonadota bacterium]